MSHTLAHMMVESTRRQNDHSQTSMSHQPAFLFSKSGVFALAFIHFNYIAKLLIMLDRQMYAVGSHMTNLLDLMFSVAVQRNSFVVYFDSLLECAFC